MGSVAHPGESRGGHYGVKTFIYCDAVQCKLMFGMGKKSCLQKDPLNACGHGCTASYSAVAVMLPN